MGSWNNEQNNRTTMIRIIRLLLLAVYEWQRIKLELISIIYKLVWHAMEMKYVAQSNALKLREV